ncbi:MAG: hypothetical protein ACRD3G_24840 [Vicinamibacterales bacterium]
MTRVVENSALLRLGIGAVMAGGMSAGLLNASGGACLEHCDGDCYIATVCSTCDEGDPNDCIIFWDPNDQSCYDSFVCQHSCPSCWVT